MSRLAGLLLALACAMPALAEVPHSSLYRLPWPDGRSFVITQAPGGKITTHFAKSNRHAIDIAMPEGTPVLAARGGVVIASEARHRPEGEPLTDLGNFVRVRHEDGTLAVYAHLAHEGVAVELGETVEAGRLLGTSGTTGYSSGPHLHFGVSRMEGGFEVSVPVRFYIGAPPLVFDARPALTVTANYTSAAEFPRVPSERRLVPWKLTVLAPDELPIAWAELAAWLAAALAGMAWFWRFSRS